MARFRGRVEDAWAMEKGTALFSTDIDGMPQEGVLVRVGDTVLPILAVGRNTTDGQPVSFRDCLTGKPVPGYCHLIFGDDGTGASAGRSCGGGA